MQAISYRHNGPAHEVLTLDEWDTPEPGPGEVRVQLHTSGVNPSDVKSRAGRPPAFERIIPHSDGAGIIDAVGHDVDPGRVGERVWIYNGQWQRAMGTCAPYIALPAEQAVRLPEHVSFEAGACLGIPALTAWQAIEHAGDIEGKTVLVIGAANAVGAYAVQLAKRKGARVVGTVGNHVKAELARALGADHVVNYKQAGFIEDLTKLVGVDGIDVIVDMDFSSVNTFVTANLLKPHGTVVCYGSNDMTHVSFDFKTWLYKSITVKLFLVYDLTAAQRSAAIEGLSVLLQANTLQHQIGARFSLAETATAHEAVEQGSVVGNVIIELVGDAS
jgi:NADPH2:quinone reductase